MQAQMDNTASSTPSGAARPAAVAAALLLLRMLQLLLLLLCIRSLGLTGRCARWAVLATAVLAANAGASHIAAINPPHVNIAPPNITTRPHRRRPIATSHSSQRSPIASHHSITQHITTHNGLQRLVAQHSTAYTSCPMTQHTPVASCSGSAACRRPAPYPSPSAWGAEQQPPIQRRREPTPPCAAPVAAALLQRNRCCCGCASLTD
jgi:hypothetical protein